MISSLFFAPATRPASVRSFQVAFSVRDGLLSKDFIMVERRTELKRRYHRKTKMKKLKAKLAAAKPGPDRDNILRKIHLLSPWWTEPAESA